MNGIIWRQRFRLLFIPLALAALVWAVWLLWGSLPVLRTNLSRLQVQWLLLMLAGNLVAGYLGFEAFRALFERMRPHLYGRVQLAHLYFTGQLMKHLPGRIWGVAYQSVTGNRASLAEWTSVTALYMVLATWFALWVASIVLGLMLRWEYGAFAVVVGAAVYMLGWQVRPLTGLLNLVRRIPLRALSRICDALQPFAGADARFKLRVWFWFVGSWLIYLLAWSGYGLAWPGLTATDGVWLCAIYTLAWFVGYISLISPSGIGVRELVFVLLAHGFPPDAIAGLAVLGRAMLLMIDVMLALSFARFGTEPTKLP